MPPEPLLPAVVLARAVVADVEAQAAEPVAMVPVDVAVAVVLARAVVAVMLPLHQQIAALKCRAWRSSICYWLPV